MADVKATSITFECNNNAYIRNTKKKGRGLFAKKKLKEGDEILVERPLICCQFSWNALYKYTACDNCMKSLETAEEMARRLSGQYDFTLPHKECCETKHLQSLISRCQSCNAIYCCEECKLDAYEKYHKTLCIGSAKEDPDHPLNKLDQAWREFHYPPETATIGLICRMIAMVMQAENADELFEKLSSFCSSPQNFEEQMVHKLLGEHFREHLELLRNMLLNTLYDEKIKQWLTPDGFRSLLAMVGMNGQGIGTSSLSQYVHNIDAMTLTDEERTLVDAQIDQLYEDIEKESGQFLNCEGSGLYVIQSCCNHSCDPNAEVTFPYNNSTLVLVALKDIEQDEEICICYLDECQRGRSRHSRQKILRENYLFQCSCSVCEAQNDTADETSSSEDETDSSMDEN